MAVNAKVNDKLQQLQRLLALGDVAGARRVGEEALAAGAGGADLLHIVGVLACQAGDPVKGATLLRKALAQRPDPTIRLNLARALLELGELDEAEGLCRDGARNNIVAGEMIRLLAEVLRQAGRPEEAAASYRTVVAAAPSDFEAWNNLGNALHDAGKLEDAVLALVRARVIAPENATIRFNLARALASTRRFNEALNEFSEAARLAPQDAPILLAYAKFLNRLHNHQAALPILGTAARISRTDPQIYVAIGVAFSGMREFNRGEQAYRMAIKVCPTAAEAYLALGLLFEQSNRIADIRQLLSDADSHGVPMDELAYLDALTLRRDGRFDEALERAKSAPLTIDANIRAQMIGQLADRLGREDEAFAAFTEMNAVLQRDPVAVHFPPDKYRQSIESLTELTTRAWYDSWRPAHVELDRAAPVFLVGFPRSGTTLLDTVLMGHPDTCVLEEEPLLEHVHDRLADMEAVAMLDDNAIKRLRDQYFTELDLRTPEARDQLVIDKLPLHLLRAPLICRIFPDAKYVFAQRHPCDVVLSCFMQNFELNRAMASFLTLEDSALLYDRVLTYWERAKEVFAQPAHLVVYERMVLDPEEEMRPLLDFLGLQWNDSVLDNTATAEARGYIGTPSYAQVSEKIYLRSSGRWSRYREHMAPVLPILTRWTERLGYGPVADAV